MASEISKYAMESAYKDVEQRALSKTAPQEQPRAILLGGQPGSGKSVLVPQGERELRNSGGAVVIDADRMREENPRYKQLSREDPQNAADRTQKEAGEWSTRLTMAAIDGKRNLIVDGTMRNSENLRELATRLKEQGYTVEARVLAVHSETSMTRARLRTEEQIVERGVGRWVNKEQHDVAYQGMVKSVAMLERDKLVDAVRVYDVNQRPVYKNKQIQGEWQRKPEATAIIEQERGRAWTHAERRDYVSALEDIHALTKQRTQDPAASKDIASKLEAAKADLSKFEQSATYQRAKAFDSLSKRDALARHPELDGAYKQLVEVRQSFTEKTPQHLRETSYFNVRAELANQLHKGDIPKGDVTQDESRRTIEHAANHRGLVVRDAAELKQDFKGEVVANSSHHSLVKISEVVAVRYEKANLDRSLEAGEKVSIQHGQDRSRVHEQRKEPAQELSRQAGKGLER